MLNAGSEVMRNPYKTLPRRQDLSDIMWDCLSYYFFFSGNSPLDIPSLALSESSILTVHPMNQVHMMSLVLLWLVLPTILDGFYIRLTSSLPGLA